MALLRDVLEWSSVQPAWVQDALRRVFTVGDLTAADYDELMHILLNANGAELEDVPEPIPLSAEHLPGVPTAGTTCLTGISGIECVNRFAAGSSIEFAPAGMTIVFGHNGSGKTGISRVLKQVCRARVRQPVLGNVYSPDFREQLPRATIHFKHEDADAQCAWHMGGDAPLELQSISIMDEACALDYIVNEGETAFQSYGLRQLEDLGDKVFAELRRKLISLSGTYDCDASRFELIATTKTEIGRLLSRITAQTNKDEVERLGTVSEAETARLKELEALLAESNGEARAVEIEAYAGRLHEVARQASRAKAYVDDRAISRWRTILEERDTTAKDREAIQALIQGEHLPGTGGDLWRQMFNAAKEFSLRQAYPGQPAPYLGDDAQCPLCQTQLNEDAKERLTAFNDFIVSDATVAAAGAEATLTTALNTIRDADLTLTLDEALEGEILAKDPVVLALLAAARDEIGLRRAWMLGRVEDRNWANAPGLTHEPGHLTHIGVIAERLRHQASEFRAAVDVELRARLEAERQELLARSAFAPHKNAVLTLISNMNKRALLTNTASSIDFLSLSRLCRTLTTRYITEALITDMTNELRELRVEGMSNSLRPRIDHGKVFVSLVVNGTRVKAVEFLSDGEKRIAAIAHFLAELNQSGSTSGIVVDDPVSSLDHKYRHRVAARLVKESTKRQVIVLTHDAVFLSALLMDQERLRLRPKVLSMHAIGGTPGQTANGLPWNNQSVPEKLDRLEADHRRLAQQWSEQASDDLCREMADTYGRVRGTLERLIRDHILGKAVLPFDDRVSIERVEAVAGFSAAEFDQINEIYLRCNAAIDAHDSTGEGGREVPHPDDLSRDITSMRSLIDQAQARTSAVRKSKEATEKATKRH